MSKVTELASAQLNGADTLRVELVEVAETPAVVIVTWPAKPTVCHLHRFPDVLPWWPVCSPPPAPSWPGSRPGGSCERASA